MAKEFDEGKCVESRPEKRRTESVKAVWNKRLQYGVRKEDGARQEWMEKACNWEWMDLIQWDER